jgi:hypothetical protein
MSAHGFGKRETGSPLIKPSEKYLGKLSPRMRKTVSMVVDKSPEG